MILILILPFGVVRTASGKILLVIMVFPFVVVRTTWGCDISFDFLLFAVYEPPWHRLFIIMFDVV